MSVSRIAIAAAIAAGALLATATSASAGAAPDKPTGYVTSVSCAAGNNEMRPAVYVGGDNTNGRDSHVYVVKNGKAVATGFELSPASSTGFMLFLTKPGVTKASFDLTMSIDGKPAVGWDHKVIRVKGSINCATHGTASVYLGEQKHGFCANGVTSVNVWADSSALLGKPMTFTYTLDGKTRTAVIPANGWWSKALAVRDGNHTLTLSGTKFRTVTFKFKTTEQCPSQG